MTDRLPSGISLVYGGTRQNVKFWRPQLGFDVLQGRPGHGQGCPLEVNPDKLHLEIASYPEAGSGWRVRLNEATPFPYHRLVVRSLASVGLFPKRAHRKIMLR